MAFTVDFLDDGRVLEWDATSSEATVTERTNATHRFYVGTQDASTDVDFQPLATLYEKHPDVVSTERVQRRPSFRREYEEVLAVDATRIDAISTLAEQAREHPAYPVGELACFNVDFSREFRYFLEEDLDPTPATELDSLAISVPTTDAGADSYDRIAVGEHAVEGSASHVLTAVQTAVLDTNPDVLILSTSEIVPTLYEMADEVGMDAFSLSRIDDVEYQQLADESTYASYGEVGHSPARYNIPGRAIIDESNTFFYDEAGLDGVVDLVARSGKPVQELAWASIGNVLTAIQIREAHDSDVLTPWHSWRAEAFKTMGTLQDADRGGYIFAPETGVHEDVHELDFSSLYPNIICSRNVSPDVIRCECHDREDVPGLGYSICDEGGFLVDVLQPLIDARDDIKTQLKEERASDSVDTDRIETLEARSSALKWILVACFGYQGFSNAKFGRIECHESINAYAREILLTAKETFEANGWHVVHGIIDSIWVTPDPEVSANNRTDLQTLATNITEAVGIRLEYEAEYDWVAFVPQRHSDAGALTRYFGSKAASDEFKVRGIEARQRSTPPFITSVQRECLSVFDETRQVEAVLARLQQALARLADGRVDPAKLVETKRVSKPREAYSQTTHSVAALGRAADRDIPIAPGQDVEYVVVDNDKTGRDRVALACEDPDSYDAHYYRDQLIRAVESILLPLGWDQEEIRKALAETRDSTLTSWRG